VDVQAASSPANVVPDHEITYEEDRRALLVRIASN
jgi:hypothetical protein